MLTLRQSTILIIVFMFLGLIGSSYFISHHQILTSFDKIEDDLARDNLVRARNALRTEIDRIDSLLRDWAWWDDTVRFVQNGSQDYESSNLVTGTFIEQKLTAIAFFTPEGRLFWGGIYEPDQEIISSLPEPLAKAIGQKSPLAIQPTAGSSEQGILAVGNEILLVASRPILTSQTTGQVFGAMVMARRLDPGLVQAMSENTQLKLSLVPLSPVNAPSLEPDLKKDPNSIRIRQTLPDLYGQPVLELSLVLPRDIHRQGMAAMRYHILIVLAASFSVGLLTLTLLERRVLRRLSSLSSQVSRVESPDNLPQKVFLDGQDELTGLAQDINRMLGKIAENEHFLEQIKDQLQAGIMIIDPATHVVLDINPYAARVIGKDVQDIVGKVCHGLVCPSEIHQCPITDLGMDMDLSRRLLITSDGQQIPILKSVSRITRDGREYLLETFVDISEMEKSREEQRRLQEQLLQSQKMQAVGTLAGGIAHDFNNLLQIIRGRVELLLRHDMEKTDRKSRLEDIERAATRGHHLVRHLLTFSRRMEPEYMTLELNSVVSTSLEFIRRTVPQMINIQFRPDPHLWRLQGDPTQMEQVLLNLVSNACDAMPNGGNIILTTENVTLSGQRMGDYLQLEPGPYVLLSVTDTGHGVDKSLRNHIFEPFFTTKEVGKGTGLGLSTVYGIVKGHRGQITCYSEKGQGTTFKIYLPAASTEMDRPEPSPAPSCPLNLFGKETILVVDDESDILDIAVEMLEDCGYKTLRASSGEATLDLLAQHPGEVDLLIMDLGMPGMGGEKCLERLRAILPGLKVIVASGYGAHPMAANPQASGARAFLPKPYRMDSLLTKVRTILDQH